MSDRENYPILTDSPSSRKDSSDRIKRLEKIEKGLNLALDAELGNRVEIERGANYRDLRTLEEAYEALQEEGHASEGLRSVRCDLYWEAVNTIQELLEGASEKNVDIEDLATLEKAVKLMREYTIKIAPTSESLREKDKILWEREE